MGRCIVLLLCLVAASFVFAEDIKIKTTEDSNDDDEENVEVSGDELEKRGDQTMSNIGYLFKGYNIIEGNPMDPTRFDPGFKAKIFEATYEKDRRTDDQQYKIPDNVDLDEKESCSSSFSAETVMTKSDYQRSLLAKASASGSAQIKVVKASFSASAEYSKTSKILQSNDKSIIKTEATCIVYEARVQTGTPPKFTSNFLETVKLLGRGQNDYGRFLDTFGTHFVESVDMGARYAKLQVISKETQEKLHENGIDIKLAAEASAAGIGSVKTDNQFKTSKKNSETFENSVEKTETVTIGSKPPSDGKQETWIAESVRSPLPIFYQLRSIVDIFSSAYFKDASVDYAKINRELSQFMQGYCDQLKMNRLPDAECNGPPKGCRGGSQCSVNAICTDDNNGDDEEQLYDCKCKSGYKGDGKICQRSLEWTPTEEIEQDENKGIWGTWGTMDYCKDGIFANGYLLKAEQKRGIKDDSGANAVCLACDEQQVCSNKGPRGVWSDMYRCPRGSFLSGWRQNVEDPRRWGLLKDDTALDNVEYKCRDLITWKETERMKGQGIERGRWSRFTECPRGQFICGIKTRVESPGGDDTALNDIKHNCCKPIMKKKKAKKTRYIIRK